MKPAYDIFLSHSSADKPAVEEIALKLREAGIEPFLDKVDLICVPSKGLSARAFMPGRRRPSTNSRSLHPPRCRRR